MFAKYSYTIYDNTLIRNILQKVFFTDSFKTSNFVENYFLKEEDTPELLASLLYNNVEYSWFILLLNDIQNYYEEWPLKYELFVEYLNKKYNYTSVVIDPDETKNINLYDIFYIGTSTQKYKVLKYDKNLNKLIINKITSNINIQDLYLYDENNNVIKITQSDKKNISYDDKFGLNYFKNNNTIVSPYDKIFADNNVTYLKSYANNNELFSVTNYNYELENNDSKRNIILIKPEYMSEIISQFNSLLKGSSKQSNILNISNTIKMDD